MRKPDLHDNTRPVLTALAAVGLNLCSRQKRRDIYLNGLRTLPQPPFFLLSKLSSERPWSQAWRVTSFYPTNRKGEAIKTAAFRLYSPCSHRRSQADGENALQLPLLYFIYTHLGLFPYLSSSSSPCPGGDDMGRGGVLHHTDHGLPWQWP